MSKYHQIKWRNSDNEELARVVRNFNAKITRLSKNPQMKNALPDKVSVKQMKEMIQTRQDLNRELNTLRRFSKRGAEQLVDVPQNQYNLKITKWQKTEMNRRLAIVNRRRKDRLEMVENISLKNAGKDLGYTRGEFGMGKVERRSLDPMNAFTRSMRTMSDIKWKWKAIINESQSDYYNKRDYLLRENYIKGLYENFNPKDVEELVKQLRNLDIKDFLTTFYSEDAPFEFIYPPNEEQLEGYLEQIISTWKNKK